jgi:hypothetical protein
MLGALHFNAIEGAFSGRHPFPPPIAPTRLFLKKKVEERAYGVGLWGVGERVIINVSEENL